MLNSQYETIHLISKDTLKQPMKTPEPNLKTPETITTSIPDRMSQTILFIRFHVENLMTDEGPRSCKEAGAAVFPFSIPISKFSSNSSITSVLLNIETQDSSRH